MSKNKKIKKLLFILLASFILSIFLFTFYWGYASLINKINMWVYSTDLLLIYFICILFATPLFIFVIYCILDIGNESQISRKENNENLQG